MNFYVFSLKSFCAACDQNEAKITLVPPRRTKCTLTQLNVPYYAALKNHIELFVVAAAAAAAAERWH